MTPTRQNSNNNSFVSRSRRRSRRGSGLNGRRFRASLAQSGRFVEHYVFTLTSGHAADVTVSNVSNRPPRSNFRPIRAVLQSIPSSGVSIQPALQIMFLSPTAALCASSNVTLLGAIPRRISLRYPNSEDWFPYDITPSSVLMRVDAVCIQGQSTSPVITCVLSIHFQTQQEVLNVTCPTNNVIIRPSVLTISSVVHTQIEHTDSNDGNQTSVTDEFVDLNLDS